jgi:hypothetical protein
MEIKEDILTLWLSGDGRREKDSEARSKNKTSTDINRVVATSKDTYSLRYFKVDQDEAEDEE